MSWLKSWLQGSGYYVTTDWYNGTRREIQDDLNPFQQLYDNHDGMVYTKRGLARVYLENFWTGLSDTFHILVGKHYPRGDESRGRKGIVDLLIFPAISRRLLSFCYRPSPHSLAGNLLFRGAQALAYPIIAALELTRFTVAAALTVAVSSIVALVHFFTWIRVPILEKRARELQVINRGEVGYYDNNVRLTNYSISDTTNIGTIIDTYDECDFYGIPSIQLLDADSQTFKKNKRQGHVRFSLFSPAEYQKTKEQQEALKAFMFLNDNAREFCMARPESTFAKAYKI